MRYCLSKGWEVGMRAGRLDPTGVSAPANAPLVMDLEIHLRGDPQCNATVHAEPEQRTTHNSFLLYVFLCEQPIPNNSRAAVRWVHRMQ